MNFGLGPAAATHRITITWPSGLEQIIVDALMADRFYQIVEGQAPLLLYDQSASHTLDVSSEIKIFPNPASNQFTIHLDNSISTPIDFEILDYVEFQFIKGHLQRQIMLFRVQSCTCQPNVLL